MSRRRQPSRRHPHHPEHSDRGPDAGTFYRLVFTKRGGHRRDKPGYEAAGRVLAIMLVALVLAALVNADALVARAERQPLGPDRDRSLAIWHPVQDVSHVLQLHRIRQLADELTGDEPPRAPTAAPVTTTTLPPLPGSTTTTLPPRPELRVPTAADPLRIWVGGDSMTRDLSESVQRFAAEEARFTATPHYEISSGLTRPDYYDWPAALAADMASTDAEVVMVMFGANDAQGIVDAAGTAHQRPSDPGWQTEYRLRVDAVMDQLRAPGRLVLWVAQPPMRDGDFDARMQILNSVYRAAAADRAWVQVVETAPLFGNADGTYADRLPGDDGSLEDLRQGDGIHLSREGADKLARHLLDIVAAELPAPAPTTTTSPTTTTG